MTGRPDLAPPGRGAAGAGTQTRTGRASDPGAPGPVVSVAGAGRLAAAVVRALTDPARETDLEVRAVPAAPGSALSGGLLVAADDGWTTGWPAVAVPLLPVRVELGTAVIGPLTEPGRPGCWWCAAQRRRAAREDGEARAALLAAHGPRLAATPSGRLTGAAVTTVAELAAEEAERVLAGAEPRTRGAFLAVELAGLAVGRHAFLPYPPCPRCAGLPDDSAAAARLDLAPRPKPAPAAFRVRDLDEIGPAVVGAYVDAEAGLIRRVRAIEVFGLALAAAPMGWRDTGRADSGWGRSLDHRGSRYAAVLEALERYAGLAPGHRRTAVRESPAALGDTALDPRELGLYPPERYALPRFPYPPYDPDRPIRWVWGHSFRRGGPILVPECFAYYGHAYAHRHGDPGDRPLAYETSNGCALGGCLEEAVLHAILEVAERDAFLLTWYARLPVAPIALDSARDASVPLIARRLERRSGYRVHAFDITMEQRVPAVWVLAVDEHPAPHRPRALCAAGAHLDPERACAAALGELAPMLVTTPGEYAANADRAARMVADSDLVVAMEDHALLYCHPGAFDRLGFLLAPPRPARAFAELPGWPALPDLRDDLALLVGRYLAGGLDVIVVDQTTPELAATGLACVKVLIPGTLPMTFGHRARRDHGLPRISTVPHLLGHTGAPMPLAERNPDPHPFP